MAAKKSQGLMGKHNPNKLKRISVTWYVPSKTDVTKTRYNGVVNIRCAEKDSTARVLKLNEQLRRKYNLTDEDNLTFIIRSL